MQLLLFNKKKSLRPNSKSVRLETFVQEIIIY